MIDAVKGEPADQVLDAARLALLRAVPIAEEKSVSRAALRKLREAIGTLAAIQWGVSGLHPSDRPRE
jgi:hypothetical protein